MSPHGAGAALHTQQRGGGLPAWAAGLGSDGEESMEIRTGGTPWLSLVGGEHALAQRDPGHKAHAGHARSAMGWPLSTWAQSHKLARPQPAPWDGL